MKLEYAEKFYRDGTLRVGSLYDFRKIEKYGEETGDLGEGTKELYTNMKHLHEGNIPNFLKDAIRVGKGSSIDIIIDGENTISRNFEDPNLYIYCVSNSFSKERMVQLGHDACIVIEKKSFFHHLHNALKQHIQQNSVGAMFRVHYGERKYHNKKDPKIPMAVIKPKKFIYQDEVRSIWYPHTEKIVEEYLYIKAPLAMLGCRKDPIII